MREICLNPKSLLERQKSYLTLRNLAQTFPHGPLIWQGHAKKCVERYCEMANETTQQAYKVATPCIDDHQFKAEEMGSVGDLVTSLLTCVLGPHW